MQYATFQYLLVQLSSDWKPSQLHLMAGQHTHHHSSWFKETIKETSEFNWNTSSCNANITQQHYKDHGWSERRAPLHKHPQRSPPFSWLWEKCIFSATCLLIQCQAEKTWG